MTSDRRQSLDKATAKSAKSAKFGSEMSSAQSNRCQSFHKALPRRCLWTPRVTSSSSRPNHAKAMRLQKLVVRNFGDAELLYASIVIYLLLLSLLTPNQNSRICHPLSTLPAHHHVWLPATSRGGKPVHHIS